MHKYLVPLALLAGAPAHAVDVIIVATGANGYALDIQATLLSSGAFTSVDIWDAVMQTPTTNDLLRYDVAVLQYDARYQSPQILGNNLAAYVDAGGGVVEPNFDWSFPGPTGAFNTGGYHAMLPAPNFTYVDDRLASNTGGFSGPYLSGQFNVEQPVAAPTATVLATYDDGGLFIAAHAPTGAGVVVAVNDYAASNAVGRTDFWDINYDGASLWANVALFAANGGGGGGSIRVSASGTCGAATRISVRDATPNANLAYATGTPGGAATIPSGPCAGRALPIGNPQLRTVRRADGTGRDTINIPALPNGACRDGLAVIDLSSCQVASTQLP